jgi:hypothetical protein
VKKPDPANGDCSPSPLAPLPQRGEGKVTLEVASNLLPPRVGSPEAVDPSPGLRPPSPNGRGQGVRGRQVNKLDQSLNFVATK